MVKYLLQIIKTNDKINIAPVNDRSGVGKNMDAQEIPLLSSFIAIGCISKKPNFLIQFGPKKGASPASASGTTILSYQADLLVALEQGAGWAAVKLSGLLRPYPHLAGKLRLYQARGATG